MRKILAILSVLIIFSTGCGSASTAIDDIKKDAAEKVQETANDVKDVAGKVEQRAAEIKNDGQSVQNATEKFLLGGFFPGMTLEEAKNTLGEPVSKHDDDEFIFANGIVVEIDKHSNVIEEIKTNQAGVATGAGIEVGMNEQKLIDAYGAANYIENHGDKIEYKYYSTDKLFKMEFEIYNGNISEIKVKMDD